MTDARSGYPRFFFLHLLMIITLYVSVVSVIVLLFQYINALFPDALNFHLQGILDSIRWSTAILIIMFPVLLFASWMVRRDIARDPAFGEAKIRRWLLTFTVFVAALAIIGDLVTLVYNFLNGELTASFLLKVLVVLLVAGAVFGYEFWELKHPASGGGQVAPNGGGMRKTIAWGASAFVFLSIVAGFFLVGSPMYQRKVRMDERRVSDLQTIQYQIIDYWQRKNDLPKTIDELSNPLTGFSVPVDPATSKPYEYAPTGKLRFELCADFETESSLKGGLAAPAVSRIPSPYERLGTEEHWNHGSGRTCFTRTIDPDLYPGRPIKPL